MKSKYKGGKHYLINPQKNTKFKQQWGISTYDLARVEGTTPDAINMRVMNYGTPFQRRSKVTFWEEQFGKTLGELAAERGVHPLTVTNRYKMFGSLDLLPGSKPREDLRDISWMTEKKYKRCQERTFFTLEWALQRLEKLNWEL